MNSGVRVIDRVALSLSLLVVLVAMALGGVAAGESLAQGPRQDRLSAAERDGLERAQQEGRAREEARERRRARPEERAARVRSRSAYRSQGDREAQMTARERLGVGQRRWERPRGIVQRLDDGVAVVQREDGQRAVALSSVPLWTRDEAGDVVPVDLSVARRGSGFGPLASVVDTRIAERVGGGVSLDGEGAVRFAPVVDDESVAGEAFGDKVYYANVDPGADTDFMVAALPTGAEALWILRSPRAAEQQALDFSLGASEALELEEATGGALVKRGEEVVARIAAPTAVDSGGTSVDVAYRVAGSRLIVDVAHRDEDLEYPIEVDPVAIVYGQGPNGSPGVFAGWSYGYNCGGLVFSSTNSTPQVVQKPPGYWPAECYGQWRYKAPGSAYVFEMDLSNVFHQISDTGAGVWYGIVNADGSSPGGGTYADGNDPPFGGQPYAEYYNVAGAARRVCTTSYDNNGGLCPSVGSAGSLAFFGMYNVASKYYSRYEQSFVYGTTLYLGDATPPARPTFSGIPSSGWMLPGTSFTVTTTQGGIGVSSLTANFPTGGYTNRLLPMGCDRSYQAPYRPCPPSASATLTIPTSASQGAGKTLSAYASTYERNSTVNSRTIGVDGSGPSITASGPLYDHRNQDDDHRREGLYDPSYPMQLTASDGSTTSQSTERSGTKTIDVRVRNAAGMIVQSSADPQPQTCAAGSCAKSRTWTLDTDSLPDGDYTIEGVATDQLGNSSAKSWRVTIDRRGDIYHALQHSSDPDVAGSAVSQDWGRYGTAIGRGDDPEGLITRAVVPCDEGRPEGPSCAEVRLRPKDEEGALAPDIAVERSTDVDDRRLTIAAETVDVARQDYGDPAASGPIEAPLLPSQKPPPNHGTEYVRFDRVETETLQQSDTDPNASPSEDDDFDSTEPGETAETITTQLFVDAKTRLPLRQRMFASNGGEQNLYWDYRSRLETTEVAADFFKQDRPPEPEAQEDTVYSGPLDVGATRDSATGESYHGQYLGPSFSLASGAFCLAAGIRYDRVEQTDPAAEDFDSEATDRDLSRLTQVQAEYNRIQAGESCSPGSGDLDSPSFEVLTYHRDSPVAAELRDQVTQIAEATTLDPGYGDFARGGVQPVTIGLKPTVAYFLPIDDFTNSVLIEVGDTTVQVIGPFGPDEANAVMQLLQQF